MNWFELITVLHLRRNAGLLLAIERLLDVECNGNPVYQRDVWDYVRSALKLEGR